MLRIVRHDTYLVVYSLSRTPTPFTRSRQQVAADHLIVRLGRKRGGKSLLRCNDPVRPECTGWPDVLVGGRSSVPCAIVESGKARPVP
jgi:hypothetical protein